MSAAAVSLAVAAMWSIGPICQKLLVRDLSVVTVAILSTVVYALATAALYACNAAAVNADLVGRLTARHAAIVVFAGLVSAFGANLVFLYAVRDHDAYVVTALAYCSPVFTLLLAALVLGERVTLPHAAGVLAVVAGAVLLST